jgi:hypothetical protein
LDYKKALRSLAISSRGKYKTGLETGLKSLPILVFSILHFAASAFAECVAESTRLKSGGKHFCSRAV